VDDLIHKAGMRTRQEQNSERHDSNLLCLALKIQARKSDRISEAGDYKLA
jgi:hypothetical protein